MTTALRFHGICKTFSSLRKQTVALDNLSFEIPTGRICGFVGPNGAGKTTAFSVVSGFVQPDAGEMELLGLNGFDPYVLKGRLGVLPQDAELSLRHTPRQMLDHLGRLQGLSAGDAQREADRLLEIVNLGDRRHDRIGALSHGMRRRVAVATALIGNPELVLLDEPLAGLDPTQALALRSFLTELRGIQTLVISSHNLNDLERMCDWVVMLDHGRCVTQGTMVEITQTEATSVWTLSSSKVDLEPLRAASQDTDISLEGATLSIRTRGSLDAASIAVMKGLAEQEIAVREVRPGVGLEQRFIDETRNSKPA